MAETIERAAQLQTIAFVVSIVFSFVGAYLLFWSGNRFQEAIKKDADVKIAKVKNEADVKIAANDRLAAEANERAKRIEQANIKLETQLQAATAESRKRQTELAKVQQKLFAEQRKTADAQQRAAEAQLALKQHLEQVSRRQQPRRIDPDKLAGLIA